jgi:hypothetical protein
VTDLTEAQLEQIEERKDPAIIPTLVATIRDQQRTIDSMRASLEVLRRDRDDLRGALQGMRHRYPRPPEE